MVQFSGETIYIYSHIFSLCFFSDNNNNLLTLLKKKRHLAFYVTHCSAYLKLLTEGPSTRASTRNRLKELFATARTLLPNRLISCRNTSELARCSAIFAHSCGRSLIISSTKCYRVSPVLNT